MSRPRLLWIGDAVLTTGFARCTHRILEVLRRTWEVHVLALNYIGDPHEWPYPIYPCGSDAFALGRVNELCTKVSPDVVMIQNDPWNVGAYLARIPAGPAKVAAMPVDGKNLAYGEFLNRLDLAVFWTEFGLHEARRGGFKGHAEVIPLGVDLGVYRPRPKEACRRRLLGDLYGTIGAGSFIVGNVNRNQLRKRLDLTIQCFAEWIRQKRIDDAWLYLHAAPTGDTACDLRQLAHYYGLYGSKKRVLLATPDIGVGVDEEDMPYSAFDAQLTTTQGEGWGLTTMEGMASGVAQIAPASAALGEWAKNAALLVRCSHVSITPAANVIGAVVDVSACADALHRVYASKRLRQELAKRGRQLVKQPQFRWEHIGRRFGKALERLRRH